ncbi:MAG: hypothetical protein ACD_41C00101G0011 [uncultured bacterium]|nr:MAG: hypothetical protein ACD_41C00101G0011 [uncultured bacterium]HBY74151.1 hypothetical protein [Candidatus Kerfeldbacteria bacterium]
MKSCAQCQQSFPVTDRDQAFYQRIGVPVPTKCPQCRFRLRLTFRNERTLYQRQCDLCSKATLSVYSPDKPYIIYCRECWWSDRWNPLDYGQAIDWSRPFFEQLLELKKRVPRIALMNDATGENSDYCNHCYRLKNCYMVFDANDNENTLYSSGTYYVKDSVDCAYNDSCELCYETMYSQDCFGLQYSRDCINCRDSAYLVDCVGVSNSLLCVGLRNVQYHYKNKPVTPEKFAELWKQRQTLDKEFEAFARTVPRKYFHGVRNEDISGDYLLNNKSVYHSFQTRASESCSYCFGIFQTKDSYDYTVWGEDAERMYEAHACGGQASDIRFCSVVWHGQDNDYCDQCLNGPKHCFGSVSLKNEQYCILNQQYSEQEYIQLRKRLIEHMTQTGEWGEFFSPALATYAYNETMANEFFPLTKEQALAGGWTWQDQLPGTYGQADPAKQIYSCTQCQKNFKLVPAELSFYERQHIPLPQRCPDCRHAERMRYRAPYQLWERQCMRSGCGNRFQTAYNPERKEIIYCEDCYKKMVY